MRKTILIIMAIMVLVGCKGNKNGGEGQMEQEAPPPKGLGQPQLIGNFGAVIDEDGVKEVDDLTEMLGNQDSINVKLAGEIIETCPKKGCWMNIKMGDGESMRVTFKDYGFFVPTDGVEGKLAVMDGYVKRTITDVATLRHFAEDAGKSEEEIQAIVAPKDEFAFVATGVIIKDNG